MKSGKARSTREAINARALGVEFALLIASLALAIYSGVHLWGTTFAKKSATSQHLQNQSPTCPGAPVQTTPVAPEEKRDEGLITPPGICEPESRRKSENYVQIGRIAPDLTLPLNGLCDFKRG